ncbi:hypothetical protein [Phenylobacterium sp.]|uniref:hypothetical protein n=1 Tax=Phenylobacterium sp. TaxID=1871053 RepID=UPI002FE377DB
MNHTIKSLAIAGLALPFVAACATDGNTGPSAAAGTGATTAAAPASGGTSTGGSTGTAQTGTSANTGATAPQPSTSGIPSLVNVNLQDVLNDLSVRLQIDRANVPINIQLPIQLAANVCGVSVNVLSVSTGGQAQCKATSAPQELAQVVQQQMAAGGSVGGGAQGGSTAATGSSTPAAGTATSGATDTSANSTGTTETTTQPQ